AGNIRTSENVPEAEHVPELSLSEPIASPPPSFWSSSAID
ncbi:hypothetical protein A2U01_0013848, partial [Trifolium medium]|nr:hypothetical protein [Trifolium medium]